MSRLLVTPYQRFELLDSNFRPFGEDIGLEGEVELSAVKEAQAIAHHVAATSRELTRNGDPMVGQPGLESLHLARS
jgi:hypothetical protein